MNTEPMAAEREIEELLQFIYLMPVAIARLGETGAVEMLNPKAVQLLKDLDIDVGRADGPALLDALQPGLAARWRDSAGRIGPVLPAQRCTPPRGYGAELHLLLRLTRPDERCTMLAIEDVTLVVEQERELARQRRRIELVLEHIYGYCVAMVDTDGTVSEWNPSIGRLFGAADRDVVGRPFLRWMAVDAKRNTPQIDFAGIQAAVARQGWCRLQTPWRRLDGTPLWGDCVITPVVDADGQTSGFVAVIRDVTEEHAREQKLIDEALTDPMTRLYNRRGLELRARELADRPAATPSTGAWIMVDIDHFKRVNDTHLHEGGDAVLKAVAASLQAAARGGDTLARIGGEEFALLLPDTSAAVAGSIAERLRLGVEALSVAVAGREIRVTASFGVAAQAPDEPWKTALERADAALFQAKNAGRNRVVLASAAAHAA